MNKLTLIIPAKNEEESLPQVLHEIKNYNCHKIVILEKSDIKTIESIKDFECKNCISNRSWLWKCVNRRNK